MTGILLCCAAIVVLVGALYLVLRHEPFVARWYYRVFPSQAVYPPEAAEAPEPDPWNSEYQRARPATEFGPLVVAGSDMDRLCGPDTALTNKYFAEIVASELGDVAVDPRVMEMYVIPEVER